MVEQIKQLCVKNGTSIKALEKELGFGNGTIRRWDTSKPSIDKILKVAEKFSVSASYLTGEEQQKKPAPISESELDLAILNLIKQLPADEKAREIAYLRERIGVLDK